MGDAKISANLDEAAGQDWEGSADLRQYLMVLVAWWREMALLVLLGALLAGAAIWAAKTFWPSYEAWADVLIVEPATEANSNVAFLGLVRGGDVAAAVAERMGSSQNAFTEVSLLEEVISAQLFTASVAPDAASNLIRISARLGSPEEAQALANAWAEEYVKKIELERKRTAQSVLDGLERTFEQAASIHEAAQAQLENALAQSRFGQLQRQIAANEQRINLIRISASLGSPEEAQALANAWAEEYVKKLELERERAAPSTLNTLERTFEQVANSHEAAQAQLENALAQSKFGQLQRQIAANEQHIAAQHKLAGQTEQLEEETRQLSSAKEREEAQLALLVQARDSAFSALEALRSKRAELRLKFATETPHVRMASRAFAPSNPLGLSATLVGATAGVILTPLAIFLAFCANALGFAPPLNRGKAISPTR